MATNNDVARPAGVGLGIPPKDMTRAELNAAVDYHRLEAARYSNEAAKVWRLRLSMGHPTEIDTEMERERLERRAAHVLPPDLHERARRVAKAFVPDCLSRTCFIRDCEREHCWGCDDSHAERERLTDIITAEFSK